MSNFFLGSDGSTGVGNPEIKIDSYNTVGGPINISNGYTELNSADNGVTVTANNTSVNAVNIKSIGNAGAGFSFAAATSPAVNQLIGSQAYSNGTYGVVAAASTNMVMSGNSFSANTTANCLLGSASTVFAYNNYPATTVCNSLAPVALGGTGVGSLTSNGVLYGGATVGATTAGSNGQLFLGVTSGAPAFATMSQDCSITNAGVTTCTKTNNVSFGTAATVNTGTSGSTIPLNNGSNTFSGTTTFSAQILSTFGTPTIASGACGATTNGSVAGTNQSGLISIGSATTTTCTVSFSTTITAPNACVLFPANAAAAATGTTVARVSSIGTTNFVVTGSALANANYYYHCL